MDTNDLRYILKSDSKIRARFIDVFALDEFKRFVVQNNLTDGIYVVNDEASTDIGNHWFLIFVDTACINFVDSFGKSPEFYNIKRELSNVKPLLQNHRQIQSSTSNVCGVYTVFFSFNFVRGKTLSEILKHFSKTDLVSNDEAVLRFLRKTF